MEDITHASAAQCLVTDLDIMEIGPQAMATSPQALEAAKDLISSYVRSMDAEIDEERCRQIAERVSRLILQQSLPTGGDAADDELPSYMARIDAIGAIFDEERLPSFYE